MDDIPPSSASPPTAPSDAGPAPAPIAPLSVFDMALHAIEATIAPLRNPQYAALWTGSLLSNIGTWAQNVATGWLVYKLAPGGRGEMWLGLNAFAGAAPTVLFLPLGGVLADRLDRRWLLGLTNLMQGVVALLLAWMCFQGHLHVWHIVAASAGMGFFGAAMAPANQSILPQLVPHRDLGSAVALNAMQFNLSRAVGPAIGGIAMVKLGATSSFALNAVSFLAVIVAVFFISAPAAHAVSPHESMLGSFMAGYRYLRGRPDLMIIEALSLLTAFCAAPGTLLPAFVERVYGGGAAEFSAMLTPSAWAR